MSKKAPSLDPQDELFNSLSSTSHGDQMWDVCYTDEETLSQVDYSLSTGIDAFDEIVGGMPFGRIVEIYGLESSGKTAMSIRCAARARQKHIRRLIRDDDNKLVGFEEVDPATVDTMVFYIDNEGSLDMDGKVTFEGEAIKFVNFRCDTTENMFKSLDKCLDSAEKWKAKYPKRTLFTLMIVDTIASTVTNKELNADWDAQDFPRAPQQISRGLARLVRRINTLNACLICTNQVRSTFKQGPSKRPTFAIDPKDYKSSGGFALRFYASHRVFFWAMDAKYKLLPTAKFSAGFQLGFHTSKNRIKPPLREGRMVLLTDPKQGGLNDAWSRLETMLFLGFIECRAKEKGVGFVLKFNKNGITPTTFGAAATTTTLDEDDDLPTPRRGGSRKDPEFKYRSEWPQFMAEHQADVDLLWKAAIAFCDNTPGLDGSICLEEEEEELNT